MPEGDEMMDEMTERALAFLSEYGVINPGSAPDDIDVADCVAFAKSEVERALKGNG